jgi:hypothetical protein
LTRTLFSSLAVAALLSAASVPPAVLLAGFATPAAACDCTNCSAQHCQPSQKGFGFIQPENQKAAPDHTRGITSNATAQQPAAKARKVSPTTFPNIVLQPGG